MVLETFKSPSVAAAAAAVLLILVLCQTSTTTEAAPTLQLPPSSYHFYANSIPAAAKRSEHPPAAADEWPIKGGMQQVDVEVADLEKLKQSSSLPNLDLELKQDDDKWHVAASSAPEEPQKDELAEELKRLGQSANEKGNGGGAVGQLEQDDKASYYNARQREPEEGAAEEEEKLPQPTQKQMQREQQQIDDEIRGENHKDRVETMETQRSPNASQNDELLHSSPQNSNHKNTRPRQQPETIPRSTSSTESNRATTHTEAPIPAPSHPLPHNHPDAKETTESQQQQQKNFPIPHPLTTADVPPINQQEEQQDLLEDTPQQNEDIYNLFTNKRSSSSSSLKSAPTLSIVGRTPELKQLNSPRSLLKGRTGSQFSAHDLAQYVFWTGDEAGVAEAIEDLIEEGLMSRESAILFLREIRTNIDYLQSLYSTGGPLKLTTSAEREEMMKAAPQSSQAAAVTPMRLAKQIPGTTLHSMFLATPPSSSSSSSSKNAFDWKQHKEEAVDMLRQGNALENVPVLMKLNQLMSSRDEAAAPTNSFSGVSNVDDTDGRLRLADYLYAEYTLEEVIYELAKVMFSQALLKGSPRAQEALQKFIAFIEVEAGQGRITPGLQTKVIDVLMKALSDTMAEHPELLVLAKEFLDSGRATNSLNSNQLLL